MPTGMKKKVRLHALLSSDVIKQLDRNDCEKQKWKDGGKVLYNVEAGSKPIFPAEVGMTINKKGRPQPMV